MTTEREIKAALDGTFRRINKLQEYVTQTVPIDFQPKHEQPRYYVPRAESAGPVVPKKNYRAPTSEAERTMIIQMRNAGASYRKISKATGRDHAVIRMWFHRWTKENEK